MFYASDLISQYLPWYYLTSLSLKQGLLPHWINNLYATGYPLLAEGETGVLSPINAFLLWALPFTWAVNSLYVVYGLIGIMGMYLFLRSQGLHVFSSILGGVIFMSSGFMLTRYFQPAIIFASSLLPLGMYVIYSSLKKPGYLAWLSVIIYLQLTAGHLQMTLISALGYLSYASPLVLILKKPISYLIHNSLFIILGFSLGAMQLLPTLKLFSLSQRLTWNPMIRFTYSLPVAHLITYLKPTAYGISVPGDNAGFSQFGGSFWEFNLTIWTMPFLLALLPIIFHSPKTYRLSIILYALWGFSLLLSSGGYFKPYHLVGRIPYFPFRVPARFLLLATFAASALSAIGFNQLMRHKKYTLQAVTFLAITLSIFMQARHQLAAYVITAPPQIVQADMDKIFTLPLATPLPLDRNNRWGQEQFIISFAQGSLLSFASACFVVAYYKILKKNYG